MRSGRTLRTLIAGASSALLGLLVLVAVAPSAVAKKAPPEVLYVGSYDNVSTPPAQTFSTIQAAVNASKPGDWIFVAPGDYHEDDDASITGPNQDTWEGWYGGVLIQTNDIHLIGVNRNSVIVDGTLPNMSDETGPCSPNEDDQNFGPDNLGQNGIVVWANDVSVDNLTVCNYLDSTATGSNSGNEIWWNGGDGSGKVALKGYEGSYLTATSTYFQYSEYSPGPSPTVNPPNVCYFCALYGIFSSNSSGGSWNQLYANNFADSGAYIGACHRVCDATVDNAWFEDNALGYSGTNSGGELLIENSKFDNNKEGLDTNTALTGDPPPPQDGECAGKATSDEVQIPGGVESCWVFTQNLVEDNNNPNVPVNGTAGLGPTGTGQTISGGRYDVVTDNQYLDNGAWGILFVPYPDLNTTSDGRTCTGTGGLNIAAYNIKQAACLYDPEGDALLNNEFSQNGAAYPGSGFSGDPDGADFGNLLAGGHEQENCFSGNTEWDPTFTTQTGPATNADAIDGDSSLTPSTCGQKTPKVSAPLLGANTDQTLLTQAECDAGLESGTGCAGANYPQATGVTMQPLPGASSLTDPQDATLPSMNPCATDIPANLWCSGGQLVGSG